MEKIVLSHEKQMKHLQQFLETSEMHSAIKALSIVRETYANDLRKDGVTLSVMHPIQIALSVLVMPVPDRLKEKAIVLALMHDMTEDYNFDLNKFIEIWGQLEGRYYYQLNCQLSKIVNGVKKLNEQYFVELVHPISALVKGLDRFNNLNSMIGCFSIEKIEEQIQETVEFVLPMLKRVERDQGSTEVRLAIYAIRFQLIQIVNLLIAYVKDKK